MKAALAAVAVVAAVSNSAQAVFTINLNYLTSPNPTQAAAFASAKSTWESVVVGYKPGVSLTGVTINVDFPAIDGPGGILGSAGPDTVTTQLGTTYTTSGSMSFDTADSGSASFTQVVLHEMGHVLGIGTLWTNNGLYATNTGQYFGPAGLAAFNAEFGQAGTWVPVELGGGGGTANAHWDEVNGGSGNTGAISNVSGQDLRYELMTGWLNTPTFMSNLTRASMIDLGYVAIVPEPTTATVGLIAGVSLLRRRRAA